jgi:hypothetical protein
MELTSDEKAPGKRSEIPANFYFGVPETFRSIFVLRSAIFLRKWEFIKETHELCTDVSPCAAIEMFFRLCSCVLMRVPASKFRHACADPQERHVVRSNPGLPIFQNSYFSTRSETNSVLTLLKTAWHITTYEWL